MLKLAVAMDLDNHVDKWFILDSLRRRFNEVSSKVLNNQ